jgi:uncharacterized protein
MMDISPKVSLHTPIITAYGGGKLVCSGQDYITPIIVCEAGVFEWHVGSDCAEFQVTQALCNGILQSAAFERIAPEILLLGIGHTSPFVLPKIRQALKEKGISLDAMSCAAACRTYNILVAEGRKVVAAIVPV